MPKKRFAKYGAKKVIIDGIQFDSKKEAERYLILKSKEKNNEITDLQLQVPFVLIPTQYENVVTYTPKRHKEKIIKKILEQKVVYVADFVYTQDGEIVVEDVKGYKNSTAYAVFVIKRKLMLFIHDIKVHEV